MCLKMFSSKHANSTYLFCFSTYPFFFSCVVGRLVDPGLSYFIRFFNFFRYPRISDSSVAISEKKYPLVYHSVYPSSNLFIYFIFAFIFVLFSSSFTKI